MMISQVWVNWLQVLSQFSHISVHPDPSLIISNASGVLTGILFHHQTITNFLSMYLLCQLRLAKQGLV